MKEQKKNANVNLPCTVSPLYYLPYPLFYPYVSLYLFPSLYRLHLSYLPSGCVSLYPPLVFVPYQIFLQCCD